MSTPFVLDMDGDNFGLEIRDVASPGEMVKTIAEVLGVPEATVVVHDRNLVIAGLRTKGGRGRSAAKMTSIDAANLLIGVAASSTVNETAETVRKYAELPFRNPENTNLSSILKNKIVRLPVICDLPDNHNFRDALAALIESATDGRLISAIEDICANSEDSIPYNIKVTFWGPFASSQISFYADNSTEMSSYSLIPSKSNELLRWAGAYSPDEGDLTQIREFSDKTIFALGDLLKS